MTIQCQISYSGGLRDNFVVEEVIRKQKANYAIRALMLLVSLVHKPEDTAGKRMLIREC